MATASDMKFLVEPLNDRNYGSWKLRMEALLTRLDLWECVSGTDKDASKAAMSRAEILLRVDNQHLSILEPCVSGKDAWQALEQLHNSKNKARSTQLRRQLVQLQKSPAESLTAYVDRARTLKNDLVSTGQKMEASELLDIILAGLPKEYETFIDILTATETTLSLDTILPKLLMVEQRTTREVEPENKAFYFKPGVVKGSNGRGSSGQSSKPQAAGLQQGAKGRGDKTCFYCGKKGHIKAECRKRQSDLQQRPQQPAHVHVALMAHSGASSSGASAPPSNEWAVDSGATMHVSPNSSLFSTLSPLPQAATVTFGNGTTGAATHSGSVVLNTEVDGRSCALTLRDVLYVPTSAVNLFSVRRAVASGAEVQFTSSGCTVSMAGLPVAVAECRNGLFSLIASTPAAPASAGGEAALLASSQEAPELWHRRFGHLGYESLARMQKHSMVSGISVPAAAFRAAKPAVCEPCVEGKQTRAPFTARSSGSSSSSSSAAAQAKPLALVHMDLCGPMPTESLGGARYNATLLDDYSGFSVSLPLATKARALPSLGQGLSRLFGTVPPTSRRSSPAAPCSGLWCL
jgi:gag-polypeptide of LTR copia-type/GAG-pre-integrase domain/Zinc knuckle